MEQVVNNVNFKLIGKMKREELNSVFEFLFGVALFFLIGTAMYYRDSGLKFWCEFTGLFIMICIYLYARTIRKGKIIGVTVNKFEIKEHCFIFTTFSFNLFLIFKLGNREYTVKKSELDICKSSYPLERLFDVNENVFKIPVNDKEFFILSQYFDTNIEELLKAIK